MLYRRILAESPSASLVIHLLRRKTPSPAERWMIQWLDARDQIISIVHIESCGFKPKNATYKEVWHTASLYHLVHTAALLAAPITKNPTIFGGLLTTGILAFSTT